MRKKIKQGVSPVIGVVLMVAVTVALVALVTVVVFDIGDDVSEPADITVNTDIDEDNNESTVEVIRNENVDELVVSDGSNNENVISTTGNVGTATFQYDTSGYDDSTSPPTFGDDQTLDVIATVGENEEIVDSIDVPPA